MSLIFSLELSTAMKNREDINRQMRRIKRQEQIRVLKQLIEQIQAEDKADGKAYAKLRQV